MSKAGKNLLISAGVILAGAGLAVAFIPTVRQKVLGKALLTDRQKLQGEIDALISGKRFVSGPFIDAIHLDGDNGARKFIFDMANVKFHFPYQYSEFSYSGLYPVNDFLLTHILVQRQINRILQSDDWAGFRNQYKGNLLRDKAAGNVHSFSDIQQDVFNWAVDDTDVDHAVDGNFKDYFYRPMYNIALTDKGEIPGQTSPDELYYYRMYFIGNRHSNPAGATGGTTGGAGATGGGTTGGGGGAGATGGGENGVHVSGDINDAIDTAQSVFCMLFPESSLCGGGGGDGTTGGGDVGDMIQCGPGSVYDPVTDSCIPSGIDDFGGGDFGGGDQCGEGSVYDPATGSCGPA